MEELAKQLKEEFDDFNIGRKHLGDVIRDINETRKRTRKQHFPTTRFRQPIDFQIEMNKFFAIIDKYDLEKIICIDETSILYFMASEYSRCYLGKRCVLKTSDNKVFQKHTLVAAIQSTGLRGYKIYDKEGITTDRLIDFLQDILRNMRNHLVVMDNAPAHKKQIIKTTVESSGNKLLYTVPYTPRTNAIENWFSVLKHYMKLDRTLTIEEIKQSTIGAIQKIRSHVYLKFFSMPIVRKNYENMIRKCLHCIDDQKHIRLKSIILLIEA
jgi:transposase